MFSRALKNTAPTLPQAACCFNPVYASTRRVLGDEPVDSARPIDPRFVTRLNRPRKSTTVIEIEAACTTCALQAAGPLSYTHTLTHWRHLTWSQHLSIQVNGETLEQHAAYA